MNDETYGERSFPWRILAAAPLFLVTQAAIGFLTGFFAGLAGQDTSLPSTMLFINTLAMIAAGLAVAVLNRFRLPSERQRQALRRHATITLRLTVPVLLIMVGTQGIVSTVLVLSQIEAGIYGAFAQSLYQLPLAGTLVGVALIPAVVEEYVFRQVIQDGLSTVCRPVVRVAVSACLFGLVHVLPIQVVSASILGLSLGYIRERSRSLGPAIWGHAASNAMVLIIRPDFTEATAVTPAAAEISASMLLAVLMTGGGILLFERLNRRLSKQS